MRWISIFASLQNLYLMYLQCIRLGQVSLGAFRNNHRPQLHCVLGPTQYQVVCSKLIFLLQVMLDEFGAEIENAESKLDATMRKMVRHVFNFIYPKRQRVLPLSQLSFIVTGEIAFLQSKLKVKLLATFDFMVSKRIC